MGPWAIPLVIGAFAMIFGGPVVGLLAVIVGLMLYPHIAEWGRQRQMEKAIARGIKAALHEEREQRRAQFFKVEQELRQGRQAMERQYRPVLSSRLSLGVALLYVSVPLVVLVLVFGGWR